MTIRVARKKPDSYQHGDLREALVQAGLKLLTEQGLAGLSLRAAAQLAGVSHAAPYRHFSDKQALVAAIAERGFRLLTASMREELTAARAKDAVEQMLALGVGYVQFGIRHPDYLRVIFGGVLDGDAPTPELRAAGEEAYRALRDVVAAGLERGELTGADPDLVSLTCWSLVHGLSTLLSSGAVPPPPARPRCAGWCCRRWACSARGSTGGRDARPPAHAADDPAQHAVPGDGVPDGLPAPARGATRVEVAQADPAIELFLRLFSRDGLTAGAGTSCAPRGAPAPRRRRRRALPRARRRLPRHGRRRSSAFSRAATPSLALRIVGRELPARGPALRRRWPRRGRTTSRWAGPSASSASTDRAKHLASLYVDDLADVDPRRHRSRASSCRATARSWRPARATLRPAARRARGAADPGRRDARRDRRASCVRAPRARPGRADRALPRQRLRRVPHRPRRSSAARPGDARRARRRLRQHRAARAGRPARLRLRRLRHPRRRRAAAAGAASSTCGDPRAAAASAPSCARRGAWSLQHRRRRCTTSPTRDTGTPTYDGLPLDRYVSLFEMLNPMHRLWSDGRWNKLTVAHGCYWKKCTFCDVSLDYIGRYEPASADLLVDRIEALVAETGQTGFHFVDEAAPPAGAARAGRAAASSASVAITWWGNIRFEKTFTPELAAAAGALGLRRRQRRARGRVRSPARRS